jgi:type III secretory pathway component EscU
MRLFRNLSLVVKLTLVAGLSMALMATVMVFAILDLSYEKAREAAELQASTALRVFEEALRESSDTIRYGQPMAITTRRRSGTEPPSSIRRTPSTGSAMSPARA